MIYGLFFNKQKKNAAIQMQQCPKHCPIAPLCPVKDRHVHQNIDKERRGRRGGKCLCLCVRVCEFLKIATGDVGAHTSSACRETPPSAPWTEAALPAGYLSISVRSQAAGLTVRSAANGQTLFHCHTPLVFTPPRAYPRGIKEQLDEYSQFTSSVADEPWKVEWFSF